MGVESIHCFNSPRATTTPSQPGSFDAGIAPRPPRPCSGLANNIPVLSINAAKLTRNMPKTS